MAHVKTAISLDEGLFQEVDRIAQELKVPRSRLFVKAMQEFVDRRRNQELLDQLNEAYKDHPNPEERKYLKRVKQRYAARIQAEDKW